VIRRLLEGDTSKADPVSLKAVNSCWFNSRLIDRAPALVVIQSTKLTVPEHDEFYRRDRGRQLGCTANRSRCFAAVTAKHSLNIFYLDQWLVEPAILRKSISGA
jgi:hypothetical protein